MTQAGNEFAPWLGVFETLRVVDGAPLFMPEHLRELDRAMLALGLETDFDFEKARSELPRLSGRWRWVITQEGTRTLFTEEEYVPSRNRWNFPSHPFALGPATGTQGTRR
jgi:hypothetical protein